MEITADGKVVYTVEADDSKINQQITQTNSKITQTGSSGSSALKEMWTGALREIGAAFVQLAEKAVSAFGDIAQAGIEYNAQMESYQTNLQTLLNGNADAAENLLDKIKQMAASTPLATADLMDATQTLMAFGAADENSVVDILQQIGDVALGDANKLQSLSLAYGQMYSTGKLQGQDLLQMINAGFNPLQELSEMGYGTVAELKEQMAQGEISVEMVQAAFQNATAEGGKFYNAMENQSRTFNGQMSTLKDNATQLVGYLTEDLFETLSTEALPRVNAWINSILDAAQTDGISGALSVAGEIIDSLIDELLSKAPDLIDTGVEAIESFLDGVQKNDDKIASDAGRIISSLISGLLRLSPDIVRTGLSIIVALANGISENLAELTPAATDAVLEIAESITDPDTLGAILDAALSIIVALSEGLISSLPALAEKAPTILANLAQFLIQSIPKLVNVPLRILDYLANGLNGSAGEKLKSVPSVIFNAIVNGIKNTYLSWFNAGKDIINYIKDGIISAAAGIGNFISGIFSGKSSPTINVSTGFNGYNMAARLPGQSHAGGLDYVPYDGYQATLHKGERVLTASDANYYRMTSGDVERKMSGNMGPAYSDMRQIIVPLYVDSREIARATAWDMGEQLAWEEM